MLINLIWPHLNKPRAAGSRLLKFLLMKIERKNPFNEEV